MIYYFSPKRALFLTVILAVIFGVGMLILYPSPTVAVVSSRRYTISLPKQWSLVPFTKLARADGSYIESFADYYYDSRLVKEEQILPIAQQNHPVSSPGMLRIQVISEKNICPPSLLSSKQANSNLISIKNDNQINGLILDIDQRLLAQICRGNSYMVTASASYHNLLERHALITILSSIH